MPIATTDQSDNKDDKNDKDKEKDKDKNGDDDKDKDKDKDKEKNTLPSPRKVSPGGGAGPGAGSGYPHLPPPLVLNPPDAPREGQKRALSAYIIEPPDILLIQGTKGVQLPDQPLGGPHLVRPDGTIGLGIYGSVFVAGMTLEGARDAIAYVLQQRQPKLTVEEIRRGIFVDVTAYNSKFYYVITDGAGYGEQVYRVPCTGNETVLDGLAQIQGLPAVSSKHHIWVARATHGHKHEPAYILPVDWCAITKGGKMDTNYQIFPGDRIYVQSNALLRLDSRLAQIISPIERVLGVTLLGSTTVNSIKSGSNNTGVGR
jgi:protein involved in polysaccharide export with SLBB domain